MAKQKKQDAQTIHYVLVIDESGSMSPYVKDTIGGYNEQIKTAKELQAQYKDQKYLFTLCTFEGWDAVKMREFIQPIALAKDLDTTTYKPGGSTALYQAVGTTIQQLAPKVIKGNSVIVTVITDGDENSSSEEWRDGTKVRGLVTELEKEGWIFNFLSGDLSKPASRTASAMGINNAQNYAVGQTQTMYATRGAELRSFAKSKSMGKSVSADSYLSKDASTVEVPDKK